MTDRRTKLLQKCSFFLIILRVVTYYVGIPSFSFLGTGCEQSMIILYHNTYYIVCRYELFLARSEKQRWLNIKLFELASLETLLVQLGL